MDRLSREANTTMVFNNNSALSYLGGVVFLYDNSFLLRTIVSRYISSTSCYIRLCYCIIFIYSGFIWYKQNIQLFCSYARTREFVQISTKTRLSLGTWTFDYVLLLVATVNTRYSQGAIKTGNLLVDTLHVALPGYHFLRSARSMFWSSMGDVGINGNQTHMSDVRKALSLWKLSEDCWGVEQFTPAPESVQCKGKLPASHAPYRRLCWLQISDDSCRVLIWRSWPTGTTYD